MTGTSDEDVTKGAQLEEGGYDSDVDSVESGTERRRPGLTFIARLSLIK